MIIERIEIENFRSLKSIDISCDTLTALLGLNSTGKSSLLYALDVFFDPGATVTLDDSYNHDPDSEILVRVTFGSLSANEREEFSSFIHDNRLAVTKRVGSMSSGGAQRYYGSTPQIKEFAWIRSISGKREQIAAFKALADSGKFPALPSSARSADEAAGHMADYERDHPDLLRPMEREQQFFGPKNIGGGKLDKYTAFVLVPAVREAASETERKGAIISLIDMLVLRKVNSRADVQKLREDFETRVREVYSQENLSELSELGESLTRTLNQYSPGAAIELSWGEAQVPDIRLPPALARLVEHEFASPVSHSGHGLQRALVLTLFQELALVQRAQSPEESLGPPGHREDGNGRGDAPVPEGRRNPDLILAIEEPELYLHPLRCRYLADLFLQLTQPPALEGIPRNQLLYATHSPYFVDLERFDHVRLARRKRHAELPVPCCEFTHFSLGAAARELAAIADRSPDEFTRESFKAHASSVITTEVSEGFFASAVVIVEGRSDAAILYKLQELEGLQWDAVGIAVVPAVGKQNLDRPLVIFRGLRIPVYLMFDGDASHRGTKHEESTRQRNVRYQRLVGVKPVDFPRTQVEANWAVLENDIEAQLKRDAGETLFEELSAQIGRELGCKPSRVMKNAEGAALFVERACAKGVDFGVLKQVAARITRLARP